MNDEVYIGISVPTDNEGYILLEYEHCGSFFRETPNDLQDDGALHVFRPSCGLTSGNYIIDDVLEPVIRMATNYVNDTIHDAFKNLEHHNRMNSMIELKVEKKPHHETEDPIRSGIKALEIRVFPCCKRTTRIESLLKMTGVYCPFCGMKSHEVEQKKAQKTAV